MERGEGMAQAQRIFWWTINESDEGADVTALDVRRKLLKEALDELGGTMLDETLVKIAGKDKVGAFQEFYAGYVEEGLTDAERGLVERFGWARAQGNQDRRLECNPVKGGFPERPDYLGE